jgi:hypothetical protein
MRSLKVCNLLEGECRIVFFFPAAKYNIRFILENHRCCDNFDSKYILHLI